MSGTCNTCNIADMLWFAPLVWVQTEFCTNFGEGLGGICIWCFFTRPYSPLSDWENSISPILNQDQIHRPGPYCWMYPNCNCLIGRTTEMRSHSGDHRGTIASQRRLWPWHSNQHCLSQTSAHLDSNQKARCHLCTLWNKTR